MPFAEMMRKMKRHQDEGLDFDHAEIMSQMMEKLKRFKRKYNGAVMASTTP